MYKTSFKAIVDLQKKKVWNIGDNVPIYDRYGNLIKNGTIDTIYFKNNNFYVRFDNDKSAYNYKSLYNEEWNKSIKKIYKIKKGFHFILRCRYLKKYETLKNYTNF